MVPMIETKQICERQIAHYNLQQVSYNKLIMLYNLNITLITIFLAGKYQKFGICDI